MFYIAFNLNNYTYTIINYFLKEYFLENSKKYYRILLMIFIYKFANNI